MHFTERGAKMKSDTFYMSMLFDFYGELLTDKQKEFFDLYYNEDLSLTEIAEHAGISRQGVRDAIVRSEAILRDVEERCGLVKKYGRYEDNIGRIAEEAAYIAKVNALSIKNYEIATHAERLLKITEEMR